jgi:hypothetical protein
MYRRTSQRGIAALALVLMLTLIGAQPAAAADRKPAGRHDGFWTIVDSVLPGAHAALGSLTGWFHGAKSSSSMPAPPAVTNVGWGIDPNGESVIEPSRVNGGG